MWIYRILLVDLNMENVRDLQGSDISLEWSLMTYNLLIGKNSQCTELDEWFAVTFNYELQKYTVSYITESRINGLMQGLESWFNPSEVLSFMNISLDEYNDLSFLHKLECSIHKYGIDTIGSTTNKSYTFRELYDMIGLKYTDSE